MFISSARVKLKSSSTDESTVIGSDKTSNANSTFGGNATLADATDSFYPSVAQRIAVWRNLTTETSRARTEYDSVLDHSASPATVESHVTASAGGHENGLADGIKSPLVDHLVAELTSSRKRNKKLSGKLANVERQVQQMQIEQHLRDHRLEAMVASRVADTLGALLTVRTLGSLDGADFATILQDESEPRTNQLGNASLLSIDDWRSVMSYIRDHGCQMPISRLPSQDDVRPSIKPSTRDVGTDARKCDDGERNEDGNHQLELALSNANRELIIENARLREALQEASQKTTQHAEDEVSQLRLQLENMRNDNSVAVLQDQNDRLTSDLEKLRRRYEQAEAKWEREAYELRAKYEAADEERFRLAQELQAVQRQMANQLVEAPHIEELANVSDHAKNLAEENKQLMTETEKLKRLVTVLRRKLSAVNPSGASMSK